jgi:hypothetical protein
MRVHSLSRLALTAVTAAVTVTSLPVGTDRAGAAPLDGGSGIIAGIDTKGTDYVSAVGQIGRTPALIDEFFPFQTQSGTFQPFPTSYVDSVVSLGSMPMITWKPMLANYKSQSVLTSIANGSLDAYITSWAVAAKAVNHKIYVRLMHEFNGDWYPWGTVVAGQTRFPDGSGVYPYTNTPAMFVAAFQHVVNLFRSAGATNVEFVWCTSANPVLPNLQSFYPGDQDVDWTGMDVYNTNTTTPTTFARAVSAAYPQMTAISSKPIMIAETASLEYSGLQVDPASKAQWITDTFMSTIPSLPQIRAVNYYDEPGRTFRIDSSPSALAAVQQVFASPLYDGVAG